MSGPGEGKIKLGKADVYIHLKGKLGANITHIDIELDKLNDILKPGEEYSIVEYLTGMVSIPVVVIFAMELFEKRILKTNEKTKNETS